MSVQHVKSKIIGLTGSIATGKTTASNYLKKLGYFVIDSDQVVKDLWQSNDQMIKKVVFAFNLDRKTDIVNQLRSFIFKDQQQLKQLNRIVHPYVFEVIQQQLMKNKDKDIIFIDMPLLFEVGYDRSCDETWLIYVTKDIQLKRLMKRDGISEVAATDRINQQMDIDQKKELADVVFDNTKDKHHLYKQILKQLKEV